MAARGLLGAGQNWCRFPSPGALSPPTTMFCSRWRRGRRRSSFVLLARFALGPSFWWAAESLAALLFCGLGTFCVRGDSLLNKIIRIFDPTIWFHMMWHFALQCRKRKMITPRSGGSACTWNSLHESPPLCMRWDDSERVRHRVDVKSSPYQWCEPWANALDQCAYGAIIFEQACEKGFRPVIASNFHRLEPIVPLRSRRPA